MRGQEVIIKNLDGGEESVYDGSLRFDESQGVFSQFPGATKKYIQNNGPRDAEYRETMARMFVQMTAKERSLFLQSVPPETRPLAKVLCGVATGASAGTGFIDFLLTQVNESFAEKYQVVEALSDNFVVYVFLLQLSVFHVVRFNMPTMRLSLSMTGRRRICLDSIIRIASSTSSFSRQ